MPLTNRRFVLVTKPDEMKEFMGWGERLYMGDVVILDTKTRKEYVQAPGTFGVRRMERPLVDVLLDVLNDVVA